MVTSRPLLLLLLRMLVGAALSCTFSANVQLSDGAHAERHIPANVHGRSLQAQAAASGGASAGGEREVNDSASDLRCEPVCPPIALLLGGRTLYAQEFGLTVSHSMSRCLSSLCGLLCMACR